MSIRSLLGAAALAFVIALPVAAGELKQGPRAVLELFTSQGCSSCPPADALLTEMSGRDDVIALAYHVDYWDYIGWADTFGSPSHSDRQRDYATAWGSSRIFTPQLIVNGRDGVVASRRGEVEQALAGAALEVPVEVSVRGDMLKVNVPPAAGAPEAVIYLVSFIDEAQVAIERGENTGKTIAYSQIVTNRQILGMWEPTAGAKMKLPMADVIVAPANGAAILVQEDRGGLPGRILGAASFLNEK